MAHPIEDYALIGNCETAALVARDGSIDWLCWPRFDSDARFAALLGTPEHGRWQIAPADPGTKVTRHYRDDTLVLETEFETADGAVTLIDFMRFVTAISHRRWSASSGGSAARSRCRVSSPCVSIMARRYPG
jgi:GH15 family glucan-1,4-alpha-glucosidase